MGGFDIKDADKLELLKEMCNKHCGSCPYNWQLPCSVLKDIKELETKLHV